MKVFHNSNVVIALILVIAMVVIGLINPAFWQLSNIFSLLKANVVIGLMALGVLLIMISGGIDVSFTAFAIAAMYLVVRTMVAIDYDGVILPFICATTIGGLLGLMNAGIIHKFHMIPLIVTLGTASLVRGLVLGGVGTSNVNINEMPPSLIELGRANIVTLERTDGTTFGLTAMILVYAVLAILMHFVLTRTMIGRSVYAYGADSEAARRVGFKTGRTMIFVYCTAGALAGFAGLLHSSMSWLANPRGFVGLELDVIAAVVLGGCSIFGGRGSVIGTVLGVFMLVMIQNSLILMGIDMTWQRVVVGAVLICAVAITAMRDRRSPA